MPRPLIILGVLAAWLGAVGMSAAVAQSSPTQAASAYPASAYPANEFVGGYGGLISGEQWELYKKAFAAARSGQWSLARRLAAKAKDPLPDKLITWLYLSEPGSPARFEEIADFLGGNPHWPRRRTLLRHAEAAMSGRLPDERVVAWFADHPAVSGPGRVRVAEALMGQGRHEVGAAWLRYAWAVDDFSLRQQRRIQRRHRKLLTEADYEARLDRLLWNGQVSAARRMLHHVSEGFRALAVARIGLMQRSGGVDAAIAKVPPELKNHPGLVYERLRWRRRKGFDARARELLVDPPEDIVRPEVWWTERGIQARMVLVKGSAAQAYHLAREHGQVDGESFAEAEWLAGWIALRGLGDARAAYGHFARVYDAVRFAISRARGAYWAGRAAESLGETELARDWFAKAARHRTAFYGQLAAQRLERSGALGLAPDPKPSAEEVAAFNRRELVRAVRLLAELGESKRLEPFIMTLNKQARTPAEHVLVAKLAHSVGRTDLAVASAKQSARAGVMVAERNYPLVGLPPNAGPEPSLLLAVSRQESEFNPRAVSSSGARGLMQLQPRTAKVVARKHKILYVKAKLTQDPAYNAVLGAAYLADLIDRYGGSYVLALAAYNAGTARVGRWLREHGDPRTGKVDVIDWIELISFPETRNYVQRVLEGLQVYRHRLNGATVTLELEEDLRR